MRKEQSAHFSSILSVSPIVQNNLSSSLTGSSRTLDWKTTHGSRFSWTQQVLGEQFLSHLLLINYVTCSFTFYNHLSTFVLSEGSGKWWRGARSQSVNGYNLFQSYQSSSAWQSSLPKACRPPVWPLSRATGQNTRKVGLLLSPPASQAPPFNGWSKRTNIWFLPLWRNLEFALL